MLYPLLRPIAAMTASQLNLMERARKADTEAIAALMNRSLQPKGITAKVSLKEHCLKVMLEAPQAPEQKALVEFIRKGIAGLNTGAIKQVKVYGRELGDDFPNWQEEFELTVQAAPDIAELAQQRDVNAVDRLVAHWVEAYSATAKVSLKDDCLRIMLEAIGVPDQQKFVPLLLDNVKTLGIQGCTKLKLSGREPGDDFPDWQQDFELAKSINPIASLPVESVALIPEPITQSLNLEKTSTEEPSFWGSMFGAVAGAVGAVGGTAAYAGGAVAGTVAETSGSVGNAAVSASGAIAGTAFGTAGAIGNAALQATDGAGYIFDLINSSPQLQDLTKALNVDWLLKIADQVDIVKAETHVKNLQQKYPNEKPGDIAHHVMQEKALYVGGTGFASSLLPGFAAAMIAMDLAATTALQAEMIYQIASAYGLNLHEPARKGEVMAIFGLALGGNAALTAGLGFARNIPVAGAVIGAGSNAAMLYSLGSAACRFYEAKLTPLSPPTALKASQIESEKYLQGAIVQQVIMDQILVHVVLAGNPGKTWEAILPELKAFGFSSASLEAIAANAKSPPALEKLLDQINYDFAIPLLAQCQKIAQQDGMITPAEARVLAIVTNKLNIQQV
jgi:uncharacterized protein (DUF697 family)